jgi:DNA-binding transcriptional MocR family regulator
MYEEQTMTSSSGALAAAKTAARHDDTVNVRFSPLRQVSDELEVSMSEAHAALDQLEAQLAPVSRGASSMPAELKKPPQPEVSADSEAVQRLNAVRNTVHQLTARLRLLIERLDV